MTLAWRPASFITLKERSISDLPMFPRPFEHHKPLHSPAVVHSCLHRERTDDTSRMLNLDAFSLLRVQQVNRQVSDNVIGSTKLQWQMGLSPDTKHDFR